MDWKYSGRERIRTEIWNNDMTLKELIQELEKLRAEWFANYETSEIRNHPARIDELMAQIEDHPDHRDFESDLAKAVGDDILDERVAAEVWGALANVDWNNESGDKYSCSWRVAGGLVAEMRNDLDKRVREDYLDWYMSGHDNYVPDWLEAAMKDFGWTPTLYDGNDYLKEIKEDQ